MKSVNPSASHIVVCVVGPGSTQAGESGAIVIARLRELLPTSTIETAGIAHAWLDAHVASAVPPGEYGLSAALRRASVVVALAPELQVMGVEDPAMAFDAPLPEWSAAYLTRLLLLARAYDAPAIVWAPGLAGQPDGPATRLLGIALEGATLVRSDSAEVEEVCWAATRVVERLMQGHQESRPRASLLSPGQDARDLAESLRDYIRFLGAPQPGPGSRPTPPGRHETLVAEVLAELRHMHALAESARIHQTRMLEDLSMRLTIPRMIGAPARWLRRVLRRS